MEKISHIVRGNPRVAAVDLKSAAPVRPGAPSFGRPMGESPAVKPGLLSTADRAVAIHKELHEAKLAATEETIVQNMADKFFMDRMRHGQHEDVTLTEPMEACASPDASPPLDAGTRPADDESEDSVQDMAPPPHKYTPRGSYIDVRA